MWEWIALAIGVAFVGLYLYALATTRRHPIQSPPHESQKDIRDAANSRSRELTASSTPRQP
jgi:hypothetical protein